MKKLKKSLAEKICLNKKDRMVSFARNEINYYFIYPFTI